MEAKISGIDFDKVTAGYENVHKFKETYFWNKDFNCYIQYIARITEDTTVGSISVASGTVVGVLGSDYGCLLGEYYYSDYNPDSVYVVLPDGRTVYVDEGILERIRSEDKQDK